MKYRIVAAAYEDYNRDDRETLKRVWRVQYIVQEKTWENFWSPWKTVYGTGSDDPYTTEQLYKPIRKARAEADKWNRTGGFVRHR